MAKLQTLRELKAENERQDADRLSRVDVWSALEYQPTPKQELFHAATEFDVLFGGAAGGGKSRALVMHAIRECVRCPGIRVGAFRRTYGELKESLLVELALCGFARAVGGVWAGGEYELRFPNGSVIMFRYAESMADASRRLGGQYQLLVFDERTQTNPNVIAFLESRLRSGRAEVPVLGIRSATNPGGPGHSAVKQRYIRATSYGQHVAVDERGRTVRFVPSRLVDNPHINPEYAADLLALPEQLRKAYLEGDWDVFAGMMFAEWSYDRHVVAPITLPDTWRRYLGVDWGYSAPWAVLWAAVDEDDRVWVYREIYATGVGEAEQARRILAAEADTEQIVARYADDAMWATRGDAKPIAAVYAEQACHLTPAGKGGRVPGWQRVHSYLADGPACPHHRALGWARCPRLHVFSTCEKFVTTVPDLPHAQTGDPEDADTRADDHLSDALRYLLINLGMGPEFVILDDPGVGSEVVVASGMAVVPRANEPVWGSDDDLDAPKRGAVVASPFR